MTIDDFKAWFIEQLRDGPIKATEIPVKLAENCTVLDMRQVFNAIRELMIENKVIEIEYSNPNTEYRTKSMYFHGAAKIKMSGNLVLK